MKIVKLGSAIGGLSVPRLMVLGAIVLVSCASLVGAGPIGDKEGIPYIAPADARAMIDHDVIVCGRIKSVQRRGPVQILSFADTPKGAFEVVMYNDYASAFPDTLQAMYVGKDVCVRGFVSVYGEQPQIRLTSPDQVDVVDQLPAFSTKPRVKTWSGSELKVATYNIRNLFDDVDDPYRNDDGTSPKPRGELERVARVFHGLDADIVALQEVESRGYLERFVEVFLADMGYEYVVHFEGNDVRGIDVCLLSRLPIGAVTSYRHLKFTDAKGRTQSFNRDLLCIQVLPEGYRSFEMWVVHLKSNYGGRAPAEPVRLGEAREVRRLLDERLTREPDAAILLCGDFNDTWESAALKTIVGEGPKALHPLFSHIPTADRITYNREPYRSMIDFILASPAMARCYVDGSGEITLGSLEGSGSDHNPVTARFTLGSAQTRTALGAKK